jgi:hypothetical protein
MRFSTITANQLRSFLIVDLRPVESNELGVLGGETPPDSPHDPGNGLVPFHHGSFDDLPSSHSSTTSMDSQELFFDALEVAHDAYLTNEEARLTCYLH